MKQTVATYLLRILAFSVGALLLPSAGTAGTVSGLKITRMMMEEAYGELLFIQIDKSFTRPTCSTNTSWQFVLDLSTPYGNKVHGLLLTAYASNKSLKFVGYGTCHSAVGSVESLKRIEVY